MEQKKFFSCITVSKSTLTWRSGNSALLLGERAFGDSDGNFFLGDYVIEIKYDVQVSWLGSDLDVIY